MSKKFPINFRYLQVPQILALGPRLETCALNQKATQLQVSIFICYKSLHSGFAIHLFYKYH